MISFPVITAGHGLNAVLYLHFQGDTGFLILLTDDAYILHQLDKLGPLCTAFSEI